MQRHGRQDGTRAMIELLQLGRRLGYARLRRAIESALELGCADAAAVQHLMATDGLVHQRPSVLVEIGSLLSQYERPLPKCTSMTTCWPEPHDERADGGR